VHVNTRRWSLAWEVGLIVAAVALQSVHEATSYDAGFMYVDGVGIPAVLASVLLGMRSGVRVAVATALGIWALDSSGLVGALLKLAATLSTIVALRYATTRATLLLAGLAAFLMAGGAALLLRVLGGGALYLGIAAVAGPVVAGAAAYAAATGGGRAVVFPAPLPVRRFLVALAGAVLLRGALMVAGDLFFAVPVFFHEPAAEALRAYPPETIFLWNGVQAVIDGVSARIVASAVSHLEAGTNP
jgi:riboflavin transporter FmnP